MKKLLALFKISRDFICFKKIKCGFTMIELVVVTVVIAMLATIAVAVFENHLKKGRDSFRKTEVDTIATLVRLDRLKKGEDNYNLNRLQVQTILDKNSINVIQAEAGKHYFYGYSSQKDDFFVVVCGEENSEFFVKGTPPGIIAVRTKDPDDVCDGSSVPIKERGQPLDENVSTTNLDAYTVYKLS